MLVSAELRWFWRGEPPSEIKDGFDRGDVSAGRGCEVRRDRYFPHPGEPELGVKIRDEDGEKAQVEIKGLVATRRRPRGLEPDVGQVEIWCKWAASVTPTGAGLLVEKRRWLRRFSAGGEEIAPDERPAAGCNVELTEAVLRAPGDVWWTLGYEAFGDLARVCGVLARTLRTRPPPRAGLGEALSYPAWLKKYYGWP